MSYELKIEGMEFRAAHGCYDVEQRVGGNFMVDLVLEIADAATTGAAAASAGVAAGAAAQDDIEAAVNYVEVYQTVAEQMAIPSRIIENVAHRIAEALHERFPQIRRSAVTVAKLAPPIGGKAARVAVTLCRP